MATELSHIFRCGVCGNIVEVLHAERGTLVCCGQEMELLPEKGENEGLENHVPVIKERGNSSVVKVGSVPHPMEEKHFIEWIEVLSGGEVHRKFLRPGDAPEAGLPPGERARAYCNVHGLWASE